MRKFMLGLLLGVFLSSTTLAATAVIAGQPIRLVINGQEISPDVPPQIIDGRVMVPARFVAEPLGATVTWDGVSQTVYINSGASPTLAPSPDPVQAAQPQVITKKDLPYTYNAKNGMSMTINDYSASKTGILFNFTFKNNSSVVNRGDAMCGTYSVYDGQSTLKFIDQDAVFFDTFLHPLRAGQSATGNVSFEGLSRDADKIILIGDLEQGLNYEKFELTFKVE
jgi:hypothetical protein